MPGICPRKVEGLTLGGFCGLIGHMASSTKNPVIVKNLSPEVFNRALAEWQLVQLGIEVDRRCRVATTFEFVNGRKEMKSCRLEIEVL